MQRGSGWRWRAELLVAPLVPEGEGKLGGTHSSRCPAINGWDQQA